MFFYFVCLICPTHSQTTQDTIPEVARQYTLQLVSAGEATIDAARSRLTVVMASSDNPHGIVSFLPPLMKSVSEDMTPVITTVIRSGGLVGELVVNISVLGDGASLGSDFMVYNYCECCTSPNN